jgi:tRNA (guanine37-N1)-methyltransferase
MRINIVTIFPPFFEGPLALSIPARAAAKGLAQYRIVDLRDYTHDRHRTVDDYPFGGGAGMVMKPEPFFEAVDALQPSGPILLMSARGRPFRHEDAVRLSLESELTLLCGHYKDVDQRVADHLATEEVSLGDFVEWRRVCRARHHRCGGAAAPRCDRHARGRRRRLVLRRRAAQPAVVHASRILSRT